MQSHYPRFTVPLLALIAGVAVSALYFCQPILTLIDRSFPGSGTAVPTATFAGYAAGIVLLVPLGDRVARRWLIAGQLGLLALSCLLMAWAPRAGIMLAASFAMGVFATAAQQAVPLGAELAPDGIRGRVIGTVMTGLLLGILLARTFSGVMGAAYGWRPVFATAACVSGVLALMALLLPLRRPVQKLGYGQLLLSLLVLIRRYSQLRRSAVQQGLLFGAFNMFWVTLVLLLETPRYGMGPFEAGLFGVLGAVGALIPPLAGRVADRRGPDLVNRTGTALVLLGFVLFWLLAERTLWGLGTGVLVMDIGMQMTLISNQAQIYALEPEARGRLNTVFITGVFVGGTLGSLAGTLAWAAGGWGAMCAVGVAATIAAAALNLPRRAP